MSRNEKTIDFRAWLIAPSIAIILATFLVPTAWLLIRSFSEPSWGLQNFRTVLAQPIYAKVAWNTFSISASVTVLCLMLSYPFAYTMAHAGRSARKLLVLAIVITLWTSILVKSFAWMVLLQDNGAINSVLLSLGVTKAPVPLMYNRIGVLIALTEVQLALMIFPLYTVMSRIDANLERASSTLGARPAMTFLRVYLPLTVPGIISGCTLVFVLSIGYYVTPALMGGRSDIMIGQLIVMQIADFGNWGVAAALSVLLLVGTMSVFGILTWLGQRSRRWMDPKNKKVLN